MKKLKELRKDNGLTSEEMARKIGISIQTYYSYEQERINPPVKRLKQIAEILHCTVNDLI